MMAALAASSRLSVAIKPTGFSRWWFSWSLSGSVVTVWLVGTEYSIHRPKCPIFLHGHLLIQESLSLKLKTKRESEGSIAVASLSVERKISLSWIVPMIHQATRRYW
jgi:hypothetical protein